MVDIDRFSRLTNASASVRPVGRATAAAGAPPTPTTPCGNPAPARRSVTSTRTGMTIRSRNSGAAGWRADVRLQPAHHMPSIR